MKSKPSRLALTGMAVVCAAVFGACNCAPTLRYLTVAPTGGTIYVSGGAGAGVKAGRAAARPAVNTRRRASLTPQDITTASCGTLQYAATGYFSNGTTKDQTSAVTWSSSDATVATISSPGGLASGVGIGFANISATLAGITATPEQLEVDLLTSITVAGVAPVTNPLPQGATQQFAATGNFSLAAGGTAQQDISSQVTWATGNGNVATTDQTGLVTAVGPGTTNLTATSCDGLTVGSASVTVTGAAATTLVITPNTTTASTGTTVLFTAVEKLSDGTTQPPQSPVSWSSNATTVASINASSGLAQALSASGTPVTITATEPANSAIAAGTASLTVQAAAARFAYVANVGGSGGSGSITSYTVNPTASAPFTALATTAASSPEHVLLHPSGDLLFYIDSGGALHSDFVDSTNGTLTANNSVAVVPASNVGADTYVGVIDPTGRFIYVVTFNTNTGASVIYGFQITHTQPAGGPNDGALTAIPGLTAFTDGTLNYSTWIMTDRSGKYLYVINNANFAGQGTISQYSIDQNTGALTSIAAPVNVGTNGTNDPQFAVTDPNGHLYVADEGVVQSVGQAVSGFNITSNGSLQSIGADTAITGAVATINVITDPAGKYLYVLDGGSVSTGQVFAYNITASSGAIGSQIGSAIATGNGPTGMAIDPTGVLLAIDNSLDANISLYSVGSSGGLTAITPAVAADNGAAFVTFYTAASGQ